MILYFEYKKQWRYDREGEAASFSFLRFLFITAQKMKFSIKDFFNKYDQISKKLRIWSHLLKKSLMKNFNFCAV